MNRLNVMAVGAVSLFAASLLFAGQAGAGEGAKVAGNRSSVSTTLTPSIAPAATEAAVSPLAAVAGDAGAPVTAKPTATAVNFDGSQRGMPYALYAAIVANFPQSRVAEAISVARCETGSTWRADLVSRDGAVGSFQVIPAFHGPVPADYFGQAAQAAAIVAVSGWEPWSCQP